MQRANDEIERFMLDLVNETQEGEEILVSKGMQIESCNLPDSYESINLFVNKLQDYEDNDWKIKEEREFFKEVKKEEYSKKAGSNGIEDQEADVLFAYVTIFCGCLLCIIPYGFTQGVGSSLILTGTGMLAQNEWNTWDEENKSRKEVREI